LHDALPSLGCIVNELPENGEVPFMKEWRWLHTPGHSPGHVSFFRERDGLLIAGDAFITVRQDSFYNVLLQIPEVNGPPRYLTTDWEKAQKSVEKLARLSVKIVITGHGPMVKGEDLQVGLKKLIKDFKTEAIPDYGRFIDTDNHYH